MRLVPTSRPSGDELPLFFISGFLPGGTVASGGEERAVTAAEDGAVTLRRKIESGGGFVEAVFGGGKAGGEAWTGGAQIGGVEGETKRGDGRLRGGVVVGQTGGGEGKVGGEIGMPTDEKSRRI